MFENVIKKLFPIRDENNQPCTFPTFASQVFFNDGSVLEGKQFGGGTATVDPLTIYPVGSIYMSVNETSPASLFGGTWEQLKDRFLLGAGDSYALGSTGGEAKHTLTLDEIPSHSHSLYVNKEGSSGYYGFTGSVPISNEYKLQLSFEGGGLPHNNMPPYLAVNMWKRVS